MSELRMLTPHLGSRSARRPYALLLLDDLADWPDRLPFDQRFSLFLVMDGRDVAADGWEAWNTFTHKAMVQGLAYFSAWGPDCERLHDVMDEILTMMEVQGESERDFLMTTWHADEDLEEALEFFRDCALDLNLQEPHAPGVIALVGRPELTRRIEAFPFA